MRFRPRTGDFVEGGSYGKVWDIYDIDTSKRNILSAKRMIQNLYRYKRIIKRKDGYYLLVRGRTH